MFNYFRKTYNTTRTLFSRNTALTSLGFGNKPNHYYLVSYPKSGNTWMRFLLSNLLCQEEALTLQNIWLYIPDSHDSKQYQYIADINSDFNQLSYQFVKSHDPYFPFYRNKNVIYLVRDGRDALSSFYHYRRARIRSSIAVSDLIKWNKSISMGMWSEHVVGWVRGLCSRKIIIRYEDLLNNPHQEVQRLLEFLGWELDVATVQRAIRNSSFKSLQEIENQFGVKYQDRITSADTASPFFRKGSTGNWKETFLPEDVDLFWKYHAEGMKIMNYD